MEVQEKNVGENPYIIVEVENKESIGVFYRMEVHGIFDEIGNNILRDISQFANHFSWSGGRASQEGLRRIEAGLDATINLVTIKRNRASGFYWLFHENPDTKWEKAGKYKLDMGIRGRSENIEYKGANLIIEFEYIPNMKHDGQGGFYNFGQLNLLNWKIESNPEFWYVS